KRYSKRYPDDEEVQRRRLWESKLLEYLIHNLKADLGLATYRRGLNAYSDYVRDKHLDFNLGKYLKN
ncbi:hypothetical protein AVEN_173268-1, partial [Araneus ventricosus]